MCDEAVNDCLAASKCVPDWFLTSKTIKKFLMLRTQMIRYSTLLNILVMPYFLVMEWLFLL